MMSNRIGRLEFLFWCSAPVIVGSVVLTIVAQSVGTIGENVSSEDPKLRALLVPVVLVASVVILKASVSRLHDIGWRGWAVVLAFIPLVDVAFFGMLFILPGQKVSNTYGEPPIFLGRWRKFKSNVPD